jgi:DNA mismatch repair protein MutS2
LVGLDEIGAGTDPRFGAPIAQAVLEQLLHKESRVIATTHFSQLREWGAGMSDVLQASMAYDVNALKPLYRLVVGKPGSSFALELMRKTGFDHAWIERIKVLAGQQMGKTEDLMLQLERQNQRLQQQITEYTEKLKHSDQLIASYQQLKEKLQAKRQEFLASAREEARKLLQDTNQQIEQTIRIIKEHRAEKEVTKSARTQLEQHKERVYRDIEQAMRQAKQSGIGQQQDPEFTKNAEQKKAELQHRKELKTKNSAAGGVSDTDNPGVSVPAILKMDTLKPGSKVKSTITGVSGEVLDTKKDKVWVVFGLIKMWVPVEELQWDDAHSSGKKQRQETGFNWVEKQAGFSSQLDVRGCRLDEALMKVQLWLDEGYALGWQELQLVHGRGDGILRKGIREYLKTLNYVRSYSYQTEAAGGDGCMLISLM